MSTIILFLLPAWLIAGWALGLFWCFMHRTFSPVNVASAAVCGVFGPAAWLFVRRDL